ncbi:peptidoglycan-binding protein [Amycolatopsis magusensis]|uniref:peptidoglycan-binding protein n=1 Tax=Amycolatopsis magusensis TaxID=882444 RepID=UPI0037895F56
MTATLRKLALGSTVAAAALLPGAAGATVAAADPETAASPRATCNDYTTFAYGSTPYRVHIPSVGHQTAATDCTLRQGDSGPGVFVLQDALRRCYNQQIAQDAQYGPATRNAVQNVQNFHGLVTDGTYGPHTRVAMAWGKYTTGGAFVGCWF